jgi:flagellin FlaB
MKIVKKILEDREGAVGIGTLIIFIAMVLVAAVAAAVLINTSGILQQKAMQTGKETISQVSSNIMVTSIVGERSSSSALNFTNIKITITPNAGAGKIDLSQMVIKISNGTRMVDNLVYGTTANGASFTVTELRDADDSFSTTTPVINAGDLVYITIKVDPTLDTVNSTAIDFPVRQPMHLELIPEVGVSVTIDLTTPASYGVDTMINLYP